MTLKFDHRFSNGDSAAVMRVEFGVRRNHLVMAAQILYAQGVNPTKGRIECVVRDAFQSHGLGAEMGMADDTHVADGDEDHWDKAMTLVDRLYPEAGQR